MSYGFLFLNDSGQIVIDDTHVKPWFVGKATYTGATGPMSFGGPYASSSYDWYTANYTAPSGGSGIFLVTLPTDRGFYWAQPQYTAGGIIQVNGIWPTGTLVDISEVPEVYCFSLDPVTPSGSGYGAQVFDSYGQCVFDTNRPHINPISAPAISLPVVTLAGFNNPPSISADEYNSLGAYAAKPAIYLPRTFTLVSQRNSATVNSSKSYDVQAMFKRSGTTLIASKKISMSYFEDVAQTFVLNEGNPFDQSILVIDASRYD